MSDEGRRQRTATLADTLRQVAEAIDDLLFEELAAEADALRHDGGAKEALAGHRASERRLLQARRALEKALRALDERD